MRRPSEQPCSSNSLFSPFVSLSYHLVSRPFSQGFSAAFQQLMRLKYKTITPAFRLHLLYCSLILYVFSILHPPIIFQSCSLSSRSCSHPPFLHACCNTQSLSQTQRERETGTEYRTCWLEKDSDFFFLNEKELEKRDCKMNVIAFLCLLSFSPLLLYDLALFATFSLPIFLSLSLLPCIYQAFRL